MQEPTRSAASPGGDELGPERLTRLVDPDAFAADGFPYELARRLRTEKPVAWVEPPKTGPFWAVMRHADIRAIGGAPELFSSASRIAIIWDDPGAERIFPGNPVIINMDGAQHRLHRDLLSRAMTPKAIAPLRPRIERVVKQAVDDLAGDGSEREVDFVETVSNPIPLEVISEWLGIPSEDRRAVATYITEITGSQDPKYARGRSPAQVVAEAQRDCFAYFHGLVAERRARPRDDVISKLVNSPKAKEAVDFPLYFVFLFAAGATDTTQNTITLGLQALLEHPDQLERLRGDPELLTSATEEILRWCPTVTLMVRTALEDTAIGGQEIARGDEVALFYPSGNRDESVFPEADRFRIDRERNPHLSFGFGHHICMGAHLARLEIQCLLRELLPRLEHAELAGAPHFARTASNLGPKTLPLRVRVRPSR